MITSLQNPQVKEAVKLRDRKGRDQQQRILIDGPREIGRAIAAGVELTEVFLCEDTLRDDERGVLDEVEHGSATILPVTPAVMNKIAYGDRAEGLVAVAIPPRRTLADLQFPADALMAVLERAEKPGNVGAVVRSADAAGLAALIVADGVTDLYNPNAIRASSGSIFSLPIVAASTRDVRGWLRQHEFKVLATRVEGAARYCDVDYRGRAAIVLGSESSGLSDAWSGDDVISVSLPMRGTADSLNVSVTAAVLFYEALRQRSFSTVVL